MKILQLRKGDNTLSCEADQITQINYFQDSSFRIQICLKHNETLTIRLERKKDEHDDAKEERRAKNLYNCLMESWLTDIDKWYFVIISVEQLINDYCECTDDQDLVAFLWRIPIPSAIDFIADAWGIQYEFV